MSANKENEDKENKPEEAVRDTRLRPPTSLKRPTTLNNDDILKRPKLATRQDNVADLSRQQDTSTIQGKTFVMAPRATKIAKPAIQVNKANPNTTITKKTGNQTLPTRTTQPAKRPVWDIRGKLADLEEVFKETTERLNSRISDLENENNQLKNDYDAVYQEKDELVRNIDSLKVENQNLGEIKDKISVELEQKASAIILLESKTNILENQKSVLSSANDDIKSNLDSVNDKLTKKEKEVAELNDQLDSMQSRLRTIRQTLDDKENEARSLLKDANERKVEYIELMAKYEGTLKNYNDSAFNYEKEKSFNIELNRKFSELEIKYNEKCDSYNEQKSLLDYLKNEKLDMIRKLRDLDSKYGLKCAYYDELKDDHEKIQSTKTELDHKLMELGNNYNYKCASFDEMISNYQKLLSEKTDLTMKFSELETKFKHKNANYDELCREYEKLKHEKERLEALMTDSHRQLADLMNENKHMKEKIDNDATTINSQNIRINELTLNCDRLAQNLGLSGTQLIQLKSDMNKFKNQLAKSDVERRLMHHKIMELRGTIRVCCRVRPVLSTEDQKSPYVIEYRTSDNSMTVSSSKDRETVTGSKAESKKYDFTFDAVFGPMSSQREIFEEIEPLVQSALDGYSVCIFAYGQTGSGKTYTMEGIPYDRDGRGMIERAVEKIFNSMEPMLEKGWKYEIESSFLEIYNETIRDLLVKDSKNCLDKLDIKQKGAIKSDKSKKNGGQNFEIYIPNLSLIKVTSSNEVKNLLETANRNRSVAATKCNEFSSRSHSVFSLKLMGVNEFLNEKIEAFINLVDLAGSERLDQSGAEGERLKETQCINKSLSALKSVISSLCNKDAHVPYRDSKLTQVLRPSLGGNCKTLMFVNISPIEDCFRESLNSLRFATNVNECYIGNATQNKTSSNKEIC